MIIHGDATKIPLADNSIDTCITDPPYGLGFMGKEWDTFDKSQFGIAGNEGENDLKVKKNFKVLPRYNNGAGLYDFTLEWASQVYRVLKPGGLLLAFGGTRTYHRLVCGIEDAGFEIRDTIGWVYGSGFPKSYDISKGIDKKLGAKRKIIGENPNVKGRKRLNSVTNCLGAGIDTRVTEPNTPEAQLWHGWGTALKPAFEPIVVAMKPIDGTFVNNALTWGVAGLWIDGGRVGYQGGQTERDFLNNRSGSSETTIWGKHDRIKLEQNQQGRFPANLIHDGSDEVLECFPNDAQRFFYSPKASRFFYCAKASRSERNAGLEGMPEREWRGQMPKNDPDFIRSDGAVRTKNLPRQNFHPTVKPISLMRYLVRLTKTPTGGVVLDPFMGSGTTGCACALEGREFIGIEKEAEYVEIAEKRIAHYRLPIMDEVGA